VEAITMARTNVFVVSLVDGKCSTDPEIISGAAEARCGQRLHQLAQCRSKFSQKPDMTDAIKFPSGRLSPRTTTGHPSGSRSTTNLLSLELLEEAEKGKQIAIPLRTT
jgi:hypothetical protein